MQVGDLVRWNSTHYRDEVIGIVIGFYFDYYSDMYVWVVLIDGSRELFAPESLEVISENK